MALDSTPLKTALGAAAIEAANAAKGAVNLAVSKAGEDAYEQSGSVVAMARQCAEAARDLSVALAAVEERFPSPPT
jgi:hypothetical protein